MLISLKQTTFTTFTGESCFSHPKVVSETLLPPRERMIYLEMRGFVYINHSIIHSGNVYGVPAMSQGC